MSTTTDIHNVLTNDTAEVEDLACEPVKSLYEVTEAATSLSFLSTPRMIQEGTLSTSPIELHPVDLFFKLKAVKQRTKFMTLMNGIMEVELRVTCGVYTCGLMKMAIDYAKNGLSVPAHQICSMDGVMLNIASERSAIIRFPLATFYPYLNISTTPALDRQRMLPRIHLKTLTTLQDTSTGSNQSLQFQIFAAIKNVTINTPTAFGNSDVYVETSAPNPNVGKEATGIFSYPASIVEMVGKTLQNVPIIGKYMYATSLAASAIKNIAVLFGFSRPTTIESSNYANNLSVSMGPIDIAGYTLDPLAEVPLTYDAVGCTDCTMTFKDTIARYGMFKVVKWLASSNVNTILQVLDVNPTSMDSMEAPFVPTCLGYFAVMYKMWRGSIKFRFTFATNSFVRGKLRIIWCPDANFSSTYYTNNKSDVLAHSYNILIDLTEASQVEFIVPWGHKQAYMPVLEFATNSTADHANINGCVCMIVEEQLKAPASTFECDILVEVAAGDDFELAVPSSAIIPEYSTYAFDAIAESDTPFATTPDVYSLSALPPLHNNVTTVSLNPCGDFNTYVASSLATTTTTGQSFNKIATVSVSNAPQRSIEGPAMYYIGEKFLSHRPLLKRFFVNSTWRGATNYRYQLQPAFPIDKKIVLDGIVPKPSGFRPTPLTWVASCYAGYRGSTRVCLTIIGRMQQALTSNRINTFRSVGNLYSQLESVNQDTSFLQFDDMTGFTRHYHDLGDDIIVEFPYQYPYNYIPFQRLDDLGPDTQFAGIMLNDGPYELRHAIGEDFNFVHWNGIPPIRPSHLHKEP